MQCQPLLAEDHVDSRLYLENDLQQFYSKCNEFYKHIVSFHIDAFSCHVIRKVHISSRASSPTHDIWHANHTTPQLQLEDKL